MKNSEFENKNNSKTEDFSSVKHSVHHKRKERTVRKKRKKVNRLKSFLRFIVFILLILAVYGIFSLKGWYLPADSFKAPVTDRIEVMNSNIVPPEVIKKSLKDVKVSKLPIFFMSVRPIKKELYKIPVLKTVYVRRYGFPARIQIIVQERVPVAIIKTDLKAKPSAFFTSDGVIIEYKNYMKLYDSSSVLKILTTAAGIKKNITKEQIEEVQKIVSEVENYSSERVEYIDMRNPNDVFVKIKTASIRLGVLDSTVFERIKRIYTILPQITEVNSQVKYIDLSWDKVNYLKLKKGTGN